MKKKMLKRLLPFLLSLTMVSGTVYAEELNTGVTVELVEDLVGESTEETSVEDELGEEATEEVPAESEAEEATEEAPGESEAGEEATEEAPEEDASEEATEESPTEDASEEVAEESPAEDESEATEEVPTEETPAEEIPTEEVVEETTEITDEETGEAYYADYVTDDGFKFYLSNGRAVISGYTGYETDLKIPDVITYGSVQYNVEGIRYNAFENNITLSKVTIPGSLSYIGDSAFRGCISLKEVSIGEGITSLGEYAFRDCTSLKKVVIPSTITKKCHGAFESCLSLETVNIKTNFVGSYMFYNCKSLKSLTLADNLITINNNAFQGCISLEKVKLPAQLTEIGYYAFRGCSGLKNISLPAQIAKIGYDAFSGCTAIETIVLPASLTSLGTYAFQGCSGLRTLKVNCATVSDYCFKDCTALTSVTLSENVTSLGDRAFNNCASLKKITLPQSVASIGAYAFEYTGLTAVEIPSSVNNVGGGAFRACESLQTAHIDSAYISGSMFAGCSSLTTVTQGQNVKSISSYAFNNCSSLKNLTMGSNVTEIGYKAFYDCDALVTANIGEKVVTVGERAFEYCDNLQAVVIPASVKVLGEYAFAHCGNLQNISMTDGLTTIGRYAFGACRKLSSVYIPQSVVSISSIAFGDTALGSGEVYCERNSAADNADLYPIGTKIRYGKPVVEAPKFAVKGVINGRKVTFNCGTEGATIFYSTETSNITTADKSVAAGTSVMFSDFYGPVYARAYKNGVWSSVSRLILKIPNVKDPIITESNGKVTIKTATPECTIYYTTDGSTPSVDNGIMVKKSAVSFGFSGGTIKAIAVRSCFTNSKVTSAKIASKVNSSIKVPSFGVKGVIGGRTVTFQSATAGSRIYYSTSSTMSTNDKYVENGGSVTFENFYGTIYARTYKDGKWSNVSRLILKIPVVKTPTISWASGGYVNVKTATPGCTLIYTTNGTTPSLKNGKKVKASSSKIYAGYGNTIKVIAVRSCYTNSDVASYNR